MTLQFSAIVIGVSAGGLNALSLILGGLPAGFSVPLVVAQHRSPEPDGDMLIKILSKATALVVSEAQEGEMPVAGTVYLAPAGYHLLLERDCLFALNMDPPVHFSRPSVDVLFESAALAYTKSLIGVILTGSNADGAAGLRHVVERGGYAIVQNPKMAHAGSMPTAALAATRVNRVCELSQVASILNKLSLWETGGVDPFETAVAVSGESKANR